MRTIGFKDAFLETDAGVAHAMPKLSLKAKTGLMPF
jgi:hypothetical protein